MGNEQNKAHRYSYTREAADATAQDSAVYRHSDLTDKLLVAPSGGIRTMQRVFQTNFDQLSSREFLGFKPILRWDLDPLSAKRTPIHEQDFSYFSFRGVDQKVKHLGSALHSKGLVSSEEQFAGRSLKLLGIHSRSNVEEFMVEIACICFGLVSVQISALFTEQELTSVFEQTQLQTVFVGLEQLGVYLKLIREGKLPSLKHLVLFNSDALFPDERAALDGLPHTDWHCYEDLLQTGAKLPQLAFPVVRPEDFVSLSLTSGTTGPPKAVLISHRNAVAFLAALDSKASFLHSRSVYFSYLPLCQILEKMMFFAVSFKGGKYAVSRAAGEAMLEEVRLVQPTIFVGSPQVFERFARAIQRQIDKLPGLVGWYVKRTVRKVSEQIRSGSCEHSLLQRQALASVRQAFGGKVEILCSGSSVMDSSTKLFLMSALGCPLIEGYGTTETMGAAFFASPRTLFDLESQGGPLPSLEFKLRAVPELGLFSDAKDVFDRPTPGGEILLRGPSVFETYYKNEALTRAAIDEDGWFHTADIGVISPQTNALQILGTKQEAFKLQPGEFVFPQVLESVYRSSPLVQTIFVYGSPLRDSLVAIVNLHRDCAEQLAREKKIDFADYPSLLASPQFVQTVESLLDALALAHKLKAYQRVRAVHLESEAFSSLGLLSATLKLNRRKCRDHFEQILEQLYRDG